MICTLQISSKHLERNISVSWGIERYITFNRLNGFIDEVDGKWELRSGGHTPVLHGDKCQHLNSKVTVVRGFSSWPDFIPIKLRSKVRDSLKAWDMLRHIFSPFICTQNHVLIWKSGLKQDWYLPLGAHTVICKTWWNERTNPTRKKSFLFFVIFLTCKDVETLTRQPRWNGS